MSRQDFDVLFDNIVTRLTAASTAEAANPFVVRPDNTREMGSITDEAFVIPRLDSFDFDDGASPVGEEFAHSVTYSIDCIVKAGKGTLNAGREAGQRLRYLVQQVVAALWSRDDWNLGMPNPIQREIPDITAIPADVQTGERIIMAMRVDLTVGLVWTLATATGASIDQITVDGGRYTTVHNLEA